ncbi:unnamed protein product [Cuscuta europaea]|uniref:Uncharacterized protein n=1 Tax=Cuscuta europaea TaxID=41803 RepID=A0A9P1E988_CUSEU|nr:unnamed protein product [Cuscuta europaea]
MRTVPPSSQVSSQIFSQNPSSALISRQNATQSIGEFPSSMDSSLADLYHSYSSPVDSYCSPSSSQTATLSFSQDSSPTFFPSLQASSGVDVSSSPTSSRAYSSSPRAEKVTEGDEGSAEKLSVNIGPEVGTIAHFLKYKSVKSDSETNIFKILHTCDTDACVAKSKMTSRFVQEMNWPNVLKSEMVYYHSLNITLEGLKSLNKFDSFIYEGVTSVMDTQNGLEGGILGILQNMRDMLPVLKLSCI